jgi:hypothetical protein
MVYLIDKEIEDLAKIPQKKIFSKNGYYVTV